MILIRKIDATQEQIENITEKILRDIGLKMHCIGFDLWIEVAKYVSAEAASGSKEIDVYNGIYRHFAQKYKTSTINVERRLRYVVTESRKKIKKFFGVDYNVSNSAFLSLLLREIAERLNNY